MPDPTPPTSDWWRRGVVYQVYIRSFADGNGDGIGDVAGLRDRLPYLRDLGVDAVWITPWYPSPLHDGGYDVADYRDIAPHHGTLAEAEAFIAEAHEHGLKVIVDLVPNHTSSEHAWFREAVAAPPGHPARDRYVIRPGRGPNGDQPPSDWTAVFGGPAWHRLPDGEWYLHLFDVSQPDLNWENEEVRAEFDDILRFWLDRGVDGFRVDVAHSMVKDTTFPDLGVEQEVLGGDGGIVDHPFWDRDGVHDITRRWRAVVDEYDDRMMVAEAWVSPTSLPKYLRPDEYHQSFNFALLEADWDVAQWRGIIRESVAAARDVGSTSTWVLSNHDVMRHASRYGLPNGTRWRVWPVDGPPSIMDDERGLRRARAAALVVLALPGSAYVYQGEELGLPEVHDLPPAVLQDPTWERSGHTQKGRDGCRVPLPWTPQGPSFGFGDDAAWLPQPPRFGPLSVANQHEDPTSTLSLYRRLLRLRREHATADEDLDLLALDDVLGSAADDVAPWVADRVLVLRRGSGLVCIANMGDARVPLPRDATVLATSAPLADGHLPPDAAAWLLPTP